jgi:hypothetical protein
MSHKNKVGDYFILEYLVSFVGKVEISFSAGTKITGESFLLLLQ